MRQFGIVITGQINPGVDVDDFRNRIIQEIEAKMMPDRDMVLLGLQFREFSKTTKETGNDAASGGGVQGSGRSGNAG